MMVNGALSQIGKFITVYPADDAQAVRLAEALDNATRGLCGPIVTSDRPLRLSSVVHYRYGGFGGLTMQSRNGEVTSALRTPAGELIPDLRRAMYEPPEWAIDPFVAAGIADERAVQSPLVAGRYLLSGDLHCSARGTVSWAVDLDHPQLRVVKHARAGAQAGSDGRDARDRLRHEADALRALAPDARFPTVFDLLENGDDVYLVPEEIQGETLEQHVIRRACQGATLSSAHVVRWGRELAAMLGTVHAAELVYRDLSRQTFS